MVFASSVHLQSIRHTSCNNYYFHMANEFRKQCLHLRGSGYARAWSSLCLHLSCSFSFGCLIFVLLQFCFHCFVPSSYVCCTLCVLAVCPKRVQRRFDWAGCAGRVFKGFCFEMLVDLLFEMLLSLLFLTLALDLVLTSSGYTGNN